MRVFRKIADRLFVRVAPSRYLRAKGVLFGTNCSFLDVSIATFGSEPYLVSLGSRVRVTSGVRFITHDGGVWVAREDDPRLDVFGRIVVGNNVFIGVNSIILPGVNIGDDVVVGAGSVVTKDVPSGSVVAGCPARVLDSVESYVAKSSRKGVPTKQMSAVEKRRFLESSVWL
ncbi:acyltransferase [Dietzia cercidiphylli]|nr:acyltransferase [Dietzia cercidiphylli]